ncbi:hypothetical protein SBDP1_270035 [Syntrophobacter sp. SbD1]|nr:hypothetical protein SBDP1_270035 [Syntrophobacter sp. SbD1]
MVEGYSLPEFRLIQDTNRASAIRERVSSRDERPVTDVMQQDLTSLIEPNPGEPDKF